MLLSVRHFPRLFSSVLTQLPLLQKLDSQEGQPARGPVTE